MKADCDAKIMLDYILYHIIRCMFTLKFHKIYLFLFSGCSVKLHITNIFMPLMFFPLGTQRVEPWNLAVL